MYPRPEGISVRLSNIVVGFSSPSRVADFSRTSSIAGFSSSSRDSDIAKVFQFMPGIFKTPSIAAGVSRVFQFIAGFFGFLRLSVTS